MTLKERFEQFEDDYIKFEEKVLNKKSKRPDIHAFLLLDELVDGDSDIVSAAEHDEIYLGIDCDVLAGVVTDAQIHELVCCGVRYCQDYDCLCMFV